jgi:hypothetical protein
MNEGENLISAIRSDSLGEADSEMGVLQFASEGSGKAVTYSCCIASRLFLAHVSIFNKSISIMNFDEELV